MNRVTESLNTFQQTMDTHTAQILHLNEGQVKLAYELNYTQAALNQTIDLVNEHSEILRTHETALRTLSQMTMFLSNRLSAFVHSVETHFIHTSIENILENNLNLQFIHHKDLPQVTKMIMKATNVSLDDNSASFASIELVTRLLVKQRIDFISMNKTQNNGESDLIGQLIVSSFFAAPSQTQAPFSLYELIPVPFNHRKQRVRLAQVPYAIGIESKGQQFIRWSKSEAESCNFAVMTTCRETLAIRKEGIDKCLSEILTDGPLESCQVEPHIDPIFVQRVDQHWAISTNTTTKCHPIKLAEAENMKVGVSKEITLPPVALITTLDSTSFIYT
ncbi:unnamed protein product [Didymodactylos carnosus]|uniref:Uncharacterized protein n=1 Tax=Didymodactylos carnosus TaxID=1234261 RepID=A0A814U7X6_9BILA|nr:unnamed protein product [Didymodactylos carnosus]CAF1172899.1 unnamed protein product [Didymodactylos carnosus]CAF3735882.1 unnamed protein product [Didymodactylos carnosus]CAF3936840.1 unnamed protein product [Didymodactylos carnosus]